MEFIFRPIRLGFFSREVWRASDYGHFLRLLSFALSSIISELDLRHILTEMSLRCCCLWGITRNLAAFGKEREKKSCKDFSTFFSLAFLGFERIKTFLQFLTESFQNTFKLLPLFFWTVTIEIDWNGRTCYAVL